VGLDCFGVKPSQKNFSPNARKTDNRLRSIESVKLQTIEKLNGYLATMASNLTRDEKVHSADRIRDNRTVYDFKFLVIQCFACHT
jgi:hypothetical protein